VEIGLFEPRKNVASVVGIETIPQRRELAQSLAGEADPNTGRQGMASTSYLGVLLIAQSPVDQ
jgi:hypothetical protein